MALADLVAKLGLDIANFQTNIADALGDLDKLGAKMTKVGEGLSAAITAPLVAVGAAAFAAVEAIDKGVDAIRTKTGALGPDLDTLRTSFDNVFKGVPQSASDVGTAIAGISVGTGATGSALEALTTQLLNLARVQKVEVGPTVENATRLFNGWKVSSDEQAGTLDFIFKASQHTVGGFSELAKQVTELRIPLEGMGFDLKDSVALFASFSKAGVDVESVTTGFKKALVKLSEAGVTDTAAALQQIVNSIRDTKNSAEATTQAVNIFGPKIGTQLAGLIREGRLEMDAMKQSIDGGKDTINAAAADTIHFSEAWNTFKNKIALALEPLGDVAVKLLPQLAAALQPAIDLLTDLSKSFQDLDPHTQQFILAAAAAAAAIGPLLIAGGLLLPLLGAITAPVLLAVGAVTGIAAAFFAWRTEIAQFVVGFGVWVGKVLESDPVLQALWTALKGIGGFMADQLQPALDFVAGGFKFMYEQVSKLVNYFRDIGKKTLDEQSAAVDDLGKKTAPASQATKDLAAAHQAAAEKAAASATAHSAVVAQLLAGKTSTDTLKDATTALAGVEGQLETAYASLLTPTITDLIAAQDNVATSKDNVRKAADSLRNAEDTLQELLHGKAHPSLVAVGKATTDVTDARTILTNATKDLKEKEDSLAKSQAADQQALQEIASAEAELTTARKAVAIPVITDLKTAEDAVASARFDVTDKISDLKAAEQALSDYRSNTGVKSADALKALEVDLKTKREDLNKATTDLTTVEGTLTASRALLGTATAEVFGAEKDLETFRKDNIIPHTISLATEIKNLQTSYQNEKQAAEDLKTAEDALNKLRNASGDGAIVTAQELKDAEDHLKAARENLHTQTTTVHDDEGRLQADYRASKESIDALKASTDDNSAAMAATAIAMNALGLVPAKTLADLATQASTNFQTILTSGTASATQLRDAWIASLQAQYNAAIATTGDTSLALGISKALQQAQVAQKTGLDLLTSDWGAMYSTINADLTGFINSGIDQLFTGDMSFSGLIKKGWQKLAGDILKDLLKPWTDALTQWVASTIADVLSPITDWFKGLISGIGGIFSGLGGAIGGAAGGVGGAAGAVGSTIGNVIDPIEGAIPGIGGAVGGLAGGAIMGPIGAIGAAVGAISGIIGNFQMHGLNDTVNAMERETARMAIYLGDAPTSINPMAQKIREIIGYVQDRLEFMVKQLDDIRGGALAKPLGEISFNTYWSLKKFEAWTAPILSLGGSLADGFASVVNEIKASAKLLGIVNSSVLGLTPALAGADNRPNVTINATQADPLALAEQIVVILRQKGVIK